MFLGIPTIKTTKLSSAFEAGQSATLDCSLSADPYVDDVFWQILKSSGQFVNLNLDGDKYSTQLSVDSPSLTIHEAHLSDSGRYRCGATNTVGTSYSSELSLHVLGGKYMYLE